MTTHMTVILILGMVALTGVSMYGLQSIVGLIVYDGSEHSLNQPFNWLVSFVVHLVAGKVFLLFIGETSALFFFSGTMFTLVWVVSVILAYLLLSSLFEGIQNIAYRISA